MKTLVISVVIIAVISYILTCWAIIDVALKQFGSIEKKALWGIVAFIPFIGWLFYFLWGRKKGSRSGRNIIPE